MAGKLRLEVAAPDRRLLDEDVDEVQAPAADGYMGVLPGHAPLLTQLGSGVLSFKQDGRPRYVAVHGGIMEVLPDRVRVLASSAAWADEIDVERARAELSQAMESLSERNRESNIEQAQAAVAQARAQLEAHERGR
jgi:F-type H+-transporting ATPase subunit epsilon